MGEVFHQIMNVVVPGNSEHWVVDEEKVRGCVIVPRPSPRWDY